MRINTNIPALQSYNALNITGNALQKSINRLSTGLRINGAADDAAGLAISEKMRAQYRGLDQAVSNSQDGISMIQTAEGALNETHSILQRMRELSVQAANDTLTQEDRSYIQLEVDQQITRISNTTQFNKKQLLDGSAAAVWSSDNLETKAIINGGLREIDQFGQKKAVEGNFKITIKASPGEAEIQKSDIFKIKHKNVIMDVQLDKQKGIEKVRVDNLPAGEYSLRIFSGGANAAAISAASAINANWASGAGVVAEYGVFDTAIFSLTSIDTLEADQNVTYLFEVASVNTASNVVTFNVRAMGVDADGNALTFNGGELVLGSAGVLTAANSYESLGLSFNNTTGMALAPTGAGNASVTAFTVGSKLVFAHVATAATQGVLVSGDINSSWEGYWSGATLAAAYGVSAAAVQDREVHFKQFYLNTANGTVHEGDVVVTFNTAFVSGASGTVATFEAAYIGQVAKGDVQLRDLDKFWDANGKFMLDDPKTLQIVQGDGKKSSVTLYSTDTLEDVRKKLNDAVAFGLGQGKYAMNNVNDFVSFVDNGGVDKSNTPIAVDGTFVIRSLIPGASGRLSLSGDEDIIKAFSLNVIQDAKETQFEVGRAYRQRHHLGL